MSIDTSLFPISVESSYIKQIDILKQFRAQQLSKPDQKQKILVLGMGLGGLHQALTTLILGHETQLVEKRGENANGRLNTIALNGDTVKILQQTAVYQYLQQNRLIFPPNRMGFVNVRLQDLERAMKAVIRDIAPDTAVHYTSKVTKISTEAVKAVVTIETPAGNLKTFANVDLIVNAEGAQSATNALLNISRKKVLSKVPVIAAIFKDDRPQITGGRTLVTYLGKTFRNVVSSIYYYTILLFKTIFQREHLFSRHRQIAGALILKTPSQNYLGAGLSKAKSEELLSLKKAVEEKRLLLEKAQNQGTGNIALLESELKKAQLKYQKFTNYWIRLAFCTGNVAALLSKIMNPKGHFFNMAGSLPLFSSQVVEIGADRAENLSKQLNETAFLLCGDAAATVDPTTGLGGNSAIQSSVFLRSFLQESGQGMALKYRLENYDQALEHMIQDRHIRSVIMRRGYRPDTVPDKMMIWRQKGEPYELEFAK